MLIKSRPRRLRENPFMRSMLEETRLKSTDFIAPLFVLNQAQGKVEITSMPGVYRFGKDDLLREIDELRELGVHSVAPFAKLDENLKDSKGEYATSESNYYLEVISLLRERHKDLNIMADIALDPYSSDGHDGIVHQETGEILNDKSIAALVKLAVHCSRAGANILGPSDMMDGRVEQIRLALEELGEKNTMIMSYCAKYASSFYGPFRDALDSAPKAGDKKSYQMNPANRREALRELKLDTEEGADIVMVKPALSYLDIISDFKRHSDLPVAAYNVSGEYAMVKASAQLGYGDEQKLMEEILISIKRAGADIILSYFSKEMARLLKNS